MHVVTPSGLAKRLPHRHPPRVQPIAPRRERPCRRPRLPPRRGTAQAPSRDQGHPGGAQGRRNDPIALPCHGIRGPPVHPLFASWPWLLHTGSSLDAIDLTVHERHYERRYRRYSVRHPRGPLARRLHLAVPGVLTTMSTRKPGGGERAQTLRPSRDERRAGSLRFYTIKERGYGTHPDRTLSRIDRGGSDST